MTTLKNLQQQLQQLSAEAQQQPEESKVETATTAPTTQSQQQINPAMFYSPQVQIGKSALAQMDLFGLKPRQARPFVIGICGGSSSGKSTVAQIIKSKLKNQPQIINLIDFYLPLRGNMRRKSSLTDPKSAEKQAESDEVVEKEITEIDKHYDFDVPQAIDWELLIKGINLLRECKPFNKPLYDEHLKLRKEETEKIMPSDLIILEGHLIFCNQQVMDLLDLKVFIDTDDDVRLSRRVLKMSTRSKGSDKNALHQLQDLLYKYEKQIKPAYEKYIEPSKKFADIIIPNYGFSMDGLDLNEVMIPIPAIDLIIKQVESIQGGGKQIY